MKKMMLLVVLLMSMAVLAEDKLTIVTVSSDQFSGAVQFPASAKGDQAIVRVFYWQETGFGRLLRSKEFVIPVFAGAAVAFDEVPASKSQVRNVEVIIVSNISKQDVPIN